MAFDDTRRWWRSFQQRRKYAQRELVTSTTRPSTLRRLAKSRFPSVRRLLAQRLDLPSALYERLASDPDIRVRALAALQSLKPTTRTALLGSVDRAQLHQVLCGPYPSDTETIALLKLARQTGTELPDMTEFVWGRSHASVELLELCADIDPACISQIVSLAVHCDRELALRLATSADFLMANELARRFHDDGPILERCTDICMFYLAACHVKDPLPGGGLPQVALLDQLIRNPALPVAALLRFPAEAIRKWAPLRLTETCPDDVVLLLTQLSEGNWRPLGEVQDAACLLFADPCAVPAS